MYRKAIITSPTANASTRRTRERRRVRQRRRRKTRTPTAARQNALIVSSDTRSVSSAASSLAVISRRLCGPKKPNVIRLTCKTTAATYALATRARSNESLRCPEGNARNTCMKSTGGRRSSAWPRVNVRSLVVHESVDRKFTNPAATIRGPNRLSGLRHHAYRPHRMYDTVSHLARSVTTRGSPRAAPTNGLRRAATKEYVAAAQPMTAIVVSARALGGARAARGSLSSRAGTETAVASSLRTVHLEDTPPFGEMKRAGVAGPSRSATY